jgi:16S rRNA processing protein RimM
VDRAHGLRGEVVVTFISNRPERAAVGSHLFAGDRDLVVTASRSHHDRWIVSFEGVDDRTTAERLRGAVLTAAMLPEPDYRGRDELWVHEIIGSTVRDRAGHEMGRVVAVEANPAHDLLVLDGGGLIPMVFVVDHADAAIVVDVPDGLLDE